MASLSFLQDHRSVMTICLWFEGMPWQNITLAFLAKTFFFLFTHLKISYSSPMSDPTDRLEYFLLLAWDAPLLSINSVFLYRKGSRWVFLELKCQSQVWIHLHFWQKHHHTVLALHYMSCLTHCILHCSICYSNRNSVKLLRKKETNREMT